MRTTFVLCSHGSVTVTGQCHNNNTRTRNIASNADSIVIIVPTTCAMPNAGNDTRHSDSGLA